MRWTARIGLAAMVVSAGCASHRAEDPVAFAVMQPDGAPASADPGARAGGGPRHTYGIRRVETGHSHPSPRTPRLIR